MEHSFRDNSIELRSEKFRRIIQAKPSPLVRWGTAVIFLVFAVLLILPDFVTFLWFKSTTIDYQ